MKKGGAHTNREPEKTPDKSPVKEEAGEKKLPEAPVNPEAPENDEIADAAGGAFAEKQEEVPEKEEKRMRQKRQERLQGEKKRKLFSGTVSMSMTAFLLAVAILVTFQVTFLSLRARYQRVIDGMQLAENDLAKLSQVESLFESNYLGTINKAAIQDALLKSYALATGDRYAAYYTAEEYKALESSQKGDAMGIGVMIIPDEQGIRVVWVSSESPAEKAGLQIGDIITSVDGKGLDTVEYEAMVDAVSGKEGSTVELALLRGKESLTVSVTRGAYTSTSVTYSLLQDGTTGFIRILTFDNTTPGQFRSAMGKLMYEGAARFVFDIRGNGGGLLASVVEVLDALLPEGVIVTVVDAAGNETVYSSDEKEFVFPMAVLCNGSTASAAELFAAALRDFDKAVIVGETTFGKGVAQNTFRLSDGSAVKLTTAYYNPPCGMNYDGVGVTPDVLATMPEELAGVSLYAIAEEKDPQLQAALTALGEQARQGQGK